MSEIVAEKRPDYDFLKPLTFVFEDPQWIQKLLMGALFSLASVVLIGIFFVNGYLARLVRNVVEGLERPLPEWTDLGDMFAEGAMLFVAAFLYMIPLFFLVFLMFPFSVLTNIDNPATEILGGGGLVILSLVLMPVGLAVAVWVPAALLHAAVRRDFRAAFEFRVIGSFLKNNALNYVLAYLDWLVARMAAPLGLALCCVGVFVTSFWSMAVAAHAFGQVYRLSGKR
jgi:Protein of unknown function (DUF4013)